MLVFPWSWDGSPSRGGEQSAMMQTTCLYSTAGSWSHSRTPRLLLGPGETRVGHSGFPLPLPATSSSHYHMSAIAVAVAGQSRQEGLGSNQGLTRTAGGTRAFSGSSRPSTVSGACQGHLVVLGIRINKDNAIKVHGQSRIAILAVYFLEDKPIKVPEKKILIFLW